MIAAANLVEVAALVGDTVRDLSGIANQLFQFTIDS
jgi:hypothetical protein